MISSFVAAALARSITVVLGRGLSGRGSPPVVPMSGLCGLPRAGLGQSGPTALTSWTDPLSRREFQSIRN